MDSSTFECEGTRGEHLPRGFPLESGENASAYKVCLDLEEDLEIVEKAGGDVRRRLIYCRILGYIFHHPPGHRAVSTVATEILSCGGNAEKLLSLGQMYYKNLLCPLRRDWSPDIAPASRASPFPETTTEVVEEVTDKPSRDHSTAKKKALVRDGFRCAVTGDYDLDSLDCEDLEQRILAEGTNSFATTTQCAYIFDESIAPNTRTEGCTDDFWSILSRFGNERLVDELSGDCVHRLENIITMSYESRIDFRTLGLWFIPTDKPHNYTVKCRLPMIAKMRPKSATFTTPDEEKFPLPSPDYLRIHTACCEIGDLSGASNYLQEVFRELREMEKMEIEMEMTNVETE